MEPINHYQRSIRLFSLTIPLISIVRIRNYARNYNSFLAKIKVIFRSNEIEEKHRILSWYFKKNEITCSLSIREKSTLNVFFLFASFFSYSYFYSYSSYSSFFPFNLFFTLTSNQYQQLFFAFRFTI